MYSALSVGDLFLLPMKEEDSETILDKKKELSSLDDYQLLFNAYNRWKSSNEKEAFVKDYMIHGQNIKMVDKIKDHIIKYLSTQELTHLNSADLNTHSFEWAAVKACLTAGLYRKYILKIWTHMVRPLIAIFVIGRFNALTVVQYKGTLWHSFFILLISCIGLNCKENVLLPFYCFKKLQPSLIAIELDQT